jgi:hypothetical protein
VAPWASSAASPAIAAKPAVTTAKACVAEPAEARLRYAVPKAAIAIAPAIVVVVVVTPLMSWA